MMAIAGVFCYIIMPPTLKKWGHIGFGLSVCMYVCMDGCMAGWLAGWMDGYMDVGSRYRLETSCMDSSSKNSRRTFLVFPE